jgi:hypothetical protein
MQIKLVNFLFIPYLLMISSKAPGGAMPEIFARLAKNDGHKSPGCLCAP